jgi:hypothetical protein
MGRTKGAADSEERPFSGVPSRFWEEWGTDGRFLGVVFVLPSRTQKDALHCARADLGPHRLVVRTPAFQAGDTGSSPVGDTIGALGAPLSRRLDACWA